MIARRTTWASGRVHPRLFVAALVTLLGAVALARPAPVAACTCAHVAPLDALAHADAVGPGVEPARVGERVWLYEAQWQRPFMHLVRHAHVIWTPDEDRVLSPEGRPSTTCASGG